MCALSVISVCVCKGKQKSKKVVVLFRYQHRHHRKCRRENNAIFWSLAPKISYFVGVFSRCTRCIANKNETVAIIRDAQFEFRIWNTSKPTNYLTISRPIVMLITYIFHSCLYAGIVRVNNFLSPFSNLFLTIFENGPV